MVNDRFLYAVLRQKTNGERWSVPAWRVGEVKSDRRRETGAEVAEVVVEERNHGREGGSDQGGRVDRRRQWGFWGQCRSWSTGRPHLRSQMGPREKTKGCQQTLR